MVKRIYILMALLMVPVLTFAQYIADGIIRNANDAQPIQGAIVFIPNTVVTSITDAGGRFHIELAMRFDSLVASAVGYNTMRLGNIENSHNLVISLTSSNNSLNEVEVSANRQGRTISSLSQTDFQRTSGLSLQDALNTLPGINMQSRTPWGGQHIIIRGYYPNVDNGRSNGENFAGLGYQLFINNIPVTDATGTTIMDDIDFASLDRVDVLKGPSCLYGSYTAGAVNLYIPRPAPNQSSIEEGIIAGSYGLFRDNTTLQSSDGKTDIRINYGHQTYNGFRPNDASQKDYASFITNFNVSNKQTISTYFSYNHSNEQIAGELDSADIYSRHAISDSNYVGNNSHTEIESFRTGITDQYRFNNHFSNQTTVFATGYTLNQNYAHGFTRSQDINFGGRTAFSYDNHGDKINVSGILGAAFQKSRQDAQGNFFLPFILPPFTATTPHNIPSQTRNYAMTYNFFTQWCLRLPSAWLFTAGGGINYVEFGTQNMLNSGALYLNNPTLIKSFMPTLTPEASIAKTFNSYVTVYGSASAGYTPPTVSEMTNTAGQVDASLKPERAVQYEVGAKGSAAHNKLIYQLALFDMDITNRLTPETANDITYYTNVGRQRNMGIEFSAGYAVISDTNHFVSLVRPWVSYSYSHFTYIDFKGHGKSVSGNDTITADYSGNKVAAVMPNMINAGIDIGTRPGFYLSGTYQYMDKAPVTFDNSTYVKSYSLLRARIGYRKQLGRFGLDIFAGGDNLLGSTYYSFVFIGQNIGELAQAKDGGGGDGYIIPAPYSATFYGGFSLRYRL